MASVQMLAVNESLPTEQRETAPAIKVMDVCVQIPASQIFDVPGVHFSRRALFSRWKLASAIFVFAAVLTFVGAYVQSTWRSPFAAPRRVPMAVVAASSLGMQVEPRENGLLISWHSPLPIARSADSGVLTINDGPHHRDIDLRPGEVRKGSILYIPATGDVTLRLELERATEAPVASTLRVIDASRLSASPGNTGGALPAGSVEATRRVSNEGELQPLVTANRTKAALTVPIRSVSSVTVAGEAPSLPDIALDTDRSSPPLPVELLTGRAPEFAATHGPTQVSQKPANENADSANANQTLAPQGLMAKPEQQRVIATASKTAESGVRSIAKVQPIYVPPQPLRQVMPDPRALGRSGAFVPARIQVQIRIDENGKVVHASVQNPRAEAGPLLSAESIIAAKQWVFAPAKMRGKRVPAEYTIEFQFHP